MSNSGCMEPKIARWSHSSPDDDQNDDVDYYYDDYDDDDDDDYDDEYWRSKLESLIIWNTIRSDN